jgi:alanine racemase
MLKPTKLLAVVKANAFGHGAVEIAKAAEKEFVDFLAVAYLEEGIELREAGIGTEILLLNYCSPEFFGKAAEYSLTATLHSFDEIRRINCIEGRLPKFHLKINTGMNRLGFNLNQAVDAFETARDSDIIINGIYSHLATADEDDTSFYEIQFERFENLTNELINRGFNPGIRHLCNSAASIRFPRKCFDYSRIGISSFGVQPSCFFKDPELKPVLTFRSCISQIRTLVQGESVGYGRTFVAEENMTVAVVPVGYVDGFDRRLSNKGYVLIGGIPCKVLGRVCMDHFIADISKVRPIPKEEDEVILIGKQGDESITVEQVANWRETTNSEIASCISYRVPRRYLY